MTNADNHAWPIWLVGRLSSSPNAAMPSSKRGPLNCSEQLLVGFQLCYRTAKRSTLHVKLICVGKNGKPSKQKYVSKCFMFFSSSFAPKGKLPGASGLDCQLRKLRKHAHACVYFQNSHPCFGCCFPGETREVFPLLLHTALTD